MDADTNIAALAALVEKGDPDRFLATMAAPPAARGRLFTLQAFNLEVARAPWVTKEPLLAQMRLQFWRDVVAGAGVEAAPAHEVAGPLAELIVQTELPRGVLLAMIEAREADMERAPFADEAALWTYLEATSGGLMVASVCALGGQADTVAREYGAVQGLANYLMAVPALEAAGRLPLPDGRAQAVAALARDGLDRLARAQAARGEVAHAARPALLAAWRAGALLKQAARAPERVAAGALGQSEFARRGSLLWKAMTGR
ncbi:MAG: squalene/phytoene synthase family protein [Pararhodobacter sp.]|nr:squalene/phytoene synthase family protein [Pararhodobacter sp.]MCC5972407.1 squalene/phytoene synthase family protein [Pararhodobacter sp.]